MAGNISLWSQTDITNQSIDPAINFAEGQAPGTVNNAARAVMSGVAAWRDDLNGTLTTGGSANAQTVTTNTAYAALATGIVLAFKAGFTNTAAATLTVTPAGGSAFAAKAIRKISVAGDVALAAGDIHAAGHYIVRYDTAANGAAGAWILLNPVDAAFVQGSFTRDMTAATNASVPIMGVGFTPKFVLFYAGINGTVVASIGAVGTSLTQGVIWYNGSVVAVQWGVNTSFAVVLTETAGVDQQQGQVVSLDNDGFTFSWTKVGTPGANTATIFYVAGR